MTKGILNEFCTMFMCTKNDDELFGWKWSMYLHCGSHTPFFIVALYKHEHVLRIHRIILMELYLLCNSFIWLSRNSVVV